jgi:hypothetical protein
MPEKKENYTWFWYGKKQTNWTTYKRKSFDNIAKKFSKELMVKKKIMIDALADIF